VPEGALAELLDEFWQAGGGGAEVVIDPGPSLGRGAFEVFRALATGDALGVAEAMKAADLQLAYKRLQCLAATACLKHSSVDGYAGLFFRRLIAFRHGFRCLTQPFHLLTCRFPCAFEFVPLFHF